MQIACCDTTMCLQVDAACMQVWSIIDQKVGPYIRQVSVLNTALGYGQRWFLSMGRP